jgi:putative aldouronate transport system permease protein
MHFETRGQKVFKFFNYAILLTLSFLCLYPMLYVLFVSFSSPLGYLMHRGPLWRPIGFSTSAFETVFTNPRIISGYRNTLWIVIIGVPVNIIMTMLGAYFLSRRGVMLFKPIMILIIFTMYFSG